MANKQSGFSLVELVVVIVVVGLLAVAALPRFLDVTDEAKKPVLKVLLVDMRRACYRLEPSGKQRRDPR